MASIAIGGGDSPQGANATGERSIALGSNAKAMNNSEIAIGHNTITNGTSNGGIAIGLYATNAGSVSGISVGSSASTA